MEMGHHLPVEIQVRREHGSSGRSSVCRTRAADALVRIFAWIVVGWSEKEADLAARYEERPKN